MLEKVKNVAKIVLQISGTVLLFLVLLLMFFPDKPQKPPYNVITPTKGYSAIIRIQRDDHLCSAFVVSDEFAYTAGHCIKVTKSFMDNDYKKIFKQSDEYLAKLQNDLIDIVANCPSTAPCQQIYNGVKDAIARELAGREAAKKLRADIFTIRSSDGKETGIKAIALLKDDRRDYGVIKGDFKNFAKLPMAANFNVKSGDKLRACGFPGGNFPALCIDFEAISQLDFFYAGRSMFVPGISGGPVINANGVVVGIASAAKGDVSIMAPTIGM